jgi:type IV pilus assembly protein PilQ
VGNSVVVGSGFTTTQTPPESSSVLPPPNPAGNLVNLPISALATASNPALGLLFGIIGKDFNINLAIQALETQGKARQVAAPNVVTVQNLEAVISRGFEVPFVSQSGFGGTNVQFKDALLELRVTPNVIVEDGITKIRMKLEINNNEPDFSRAVLGNPPLFKRRGKTEVVLREGERVVIGGIVNEDAAQQIRTVPVLGRVPVLGWLFKSREVNQNVNDMIIIVTPAVVTMGGPTAAR